MESGLTPRQLAKELRNGVRPPRPLLLPLAFGLGAKVENIAPDLYRKNPTKIASALGQMRAPLRADGVTCYFDPFLETEALGAILHRSPDDATCAIRWPQRVEPRQMLDGLRLAEEVPQRGRVPVAIEVVRRMNALPGREFLLCCGVTGPLTLLWQIAGIEAGKSWRLDEVPAPAKELAASVVTRMASVFLEAGADLILIHEATLPVLSREAREEWINLLAPTINVIRFYEALPVLHLPDAESVIEDWEAIFHGVPDAVVCQPLDAAASRTPSSSTTLCGVALPLGMFESEASGRDSLVRATEVLAQSNGPVIITTEGDLPLSADFKIIAQTLAQLTRAR